MNYKNLITIEPDKRSGKPCIRGMRITTEDVLEYLASGMTEEEILEDFPYLTEDDIFASLVYGVDGEKVPKRVSDLQQKIMVEMMTPQERAAAAGKMFTANREMILASLPKDLSEKEKVKQLYFRTYGEHLPEDFFDR